MKDATYNTGRTITIELDRLGNADIWTIYQILTDGTGDVFAGHEEDASPAADPDAATEIFLHIAETADARAEGADSLQKIWLQGMKNEYKEIFGEDPAEEENEEEPAPEENEEERATPADQAVKEFLDAPENICFWGAIRTERENVALDPTNLYKAGVFEGAATMLATTIQVAGAARGAAIAELVQAIYRAFELPY